MGPVRLSLILKIFVTVSLVVFILRVYWTQCIRSAQAPSFPPRVREPIGVFFDLGANRGDSFSAFVGFGDKAQGGDALDGLAWTGPKEWDVILVEANPFFDATLQKLVRRFLEEPVRRGVKFNIRLLNSSAVWTKDGHLQFFLDTVNTVKTGHYDYAGSSVLESHPDVVRSGKVAVTIPCYDLATMLGQYQETDYVVVKMDVEGAEYEILRHLMLRGKMPLIDMLLAELHPFTPDPAVTVDGMRWMLGDVYRDWA
jgi:FkbM family methyltransferase